ncbi:MAG: class II aldolase/adducin family protein [Candidatus Eremiobacterota bacterium]
MDQAAREVIRWGRYAARAGILSGKSGNLSVRDGAGMRVTASGTYLGALKERDVIRCGLEDGAVEPGCRPSMESGMHRQLYRKLTGAGSVFHASPFYATLISCTREMVPLDLLPETMAYLRGVVRIPYYHPGSAELAEATADRLGLGEIGLLENHGVIVASATAEAAVVAVETFEILCRMLVVGRAAGLRLEVLAPGTRENLLDHLAALNPTG